MGLLSRLKKKKEKEEFRNLAQAAQLEEFSNKESPQPGEIPECRLFLMNGDYYIIQYDKSIPDSIRSYKDKSYRSIRRALGRYDFVIKATLPNIIFMQPYTRDSSLGHTTITDSEPVLFAGEMFFAPIDGYLNRRNQKSYYYGELIMWNNSSWHYRVGKLLQSHELNNDTLKKQRILPNVQTQFATSEGQRLLPINKFYPLQLLV